MPVKPVFLSLIFFNQLIAYRIENSDLLRIKSVIDLHEIQIQSH